MIMSMIWYDNDNENTTIQNGKSSSKREVYNNIILPQGTRKKANRQPNFIPKTTGKRRKTTARKTNKKHS